MAIIKCKMCGGDMELSQDKTIGTCEYCGSTMTVPKVSSEQRAAVFDRGNHFRRLGEFDKALSVYERIVQEGENDAEAHWCCALCRFGIEYVKDPASGEYLPTCHRVSFDSFLEDVDYKAALAHADVVAKAQYQKDGEKIAQVQRDILATVQKEEHFDVFICYKESDDRGQRTVDSALAQDIYYQLTEQGHRVFFARITLEDKVGQEYEPYIFAALHSAKVMIVVGTKAEYLNAVWVKNEWSRYLALMKQDRKRLLIPCYRDMDPYDLPEQLSVLQAYDMSKIGFIQDLLRGIEKVIGRSESKSDSKSIKELLSVQTKSQADNIVRLGVMSLNSGDSQKGIQQFEEALKIDPNHIGAYLGLVRATTGEKGQPYCKQLAAYSVHNVEMWLKKNPEMLDDAHSPLLDQIICSTHSSALTQATLEAGANPNGQYALYHAVTSKNRIELTKLLLDYGADVNREYQRPFGDSTEMRSPLADAIWDQKDAGLTELLIQYGANVNYIVNCSTGEFWTVLDFAVRINRVDIVQLLLNHGANPNIECETRFKKQSNHTYLEPYKEIYVPLISAVWYAKNIDIAEMLIEHHADVNYILKQFDGSDCLELSCPVLDVAIRANVPEMVKLLLERGADLNLTYTEPNGFYDNGEMADVWEVRPPLATAIMFSSDPEIVKALLDFGADIQVGYTTSSIDDTGVTSKITTPILELAEDDEDQEIIDLLKSTIQRRQAIANIAAQKKQLKSELESLKVEHPKITGLFADSRRKKMEARMVEIEKELEALGEE